MIALWHSGASPASGFLRCSEGVYCHNTAAMLDGPQAQDVGAGSGDETPRGQRVISVRESNEWSCRGTAEELRD